MSDTNGFESAPERYSNNGGRETIDRIRDSMTDQEFIQFCRGNVRKYMDRVGKKDSDDASKATWYSAMANHVEFGDLDPRSERPDFTPYTRTTGEVGQKIYVLDSGYVHFIESWGGGSSGIQEAGIIEAARQSTQGSFRGWKEDEKLLNFLMKNQHNTPFEFAGMTIEVQAPIFVFREWHRHRTQSYNEMSARYTPLPDLFYTPSVDRIMLDQGGKNKQAGSVGGSEPLTEEFAKEFRLACQYSYMSFQRDYKWFLERGVPKELARITMPVGHYSRMRASANLRNWLAFLTLRMDPAAQWEIRQFANAVAQILNRQFPHTYEAALRHGILKEEGRVSKLKEV
jgi:thymidylate synthase (FAD)